MLRRIVVITTALLAVATSWDSTSPPPQRVEVLVWQYGKVASKSVVDALTGVGTRNRTAAEATLQRERQATLRCAMMGGGRRAADSADSADHAGRPAPRRRCPCPRVVHTHDPRVARAILRASRDDPGFWVLTIARQLHLRAFSELMENRAAFLGVKSSDDAAYTDIVS